MHLQSARWAAETIAPALRGNELPTSALALQAARVHSELRLDMALCRLIIDLISNRTLTPIWLRALRVITHRATSDKKYAQSVGAVLAGIAPAKDVLAPRILWGTIEEAVVSAAFDLAIDVLHGPRRVYRRVTDTGRLAATLSLGSALRPMTSSRWGMQCALSAIEVATQIGVSLLGPHVPARPAR